MRRWALFSLLLLGCDDEVESDPMVDAAVDIAPQDGFCDQDWPVLGWANFGRGFLTTYCTSCHSAETPNRNDAPVGIDFDTEAQALALSDRILARATGDDPDMPPAGGPPPDERLRLRIWLECWADD